MLNPLSPVRLLGARLPPGYFVWFDVLSHGLFVNGRALLWVKNPGSSRGMRRFMNGAVAEP